MKTLLPLAGLAMAGLGPAHAETAPPTASPAAAQPAHIDGFRSARFGMTKSEVRHAIEDEFHISAKDIHETSNPVQRTAVLGITVPHLLPQAGSAAIDYVFGYHSHRLVQVNVVWRHAADPDANTPKALVGAGATLQSYFGAEEFPKGKVARNIGLRNGTLVLFRGIDADGHAVVLALHGNLKKTGKAEHYALVPRELTVSYAADPMHPDVFRLKKGSF